MLGGLLYGSFLGSLYVFLGASLGATFTFFLGRTFLRRWFQKRLSSFPKLELVERSISNEGIKFVILTRLSPIFPFGILNIAYSFSNIKASDFLIGLSAILPVIGPILFISLPGIESVSQYDAEPLVDDTAAPGVPPAPAAPAPPSGKAGLGLSNGGAAASGGGGGLAGTVFSKDDTNFNRNFIETKFTEFFRVVPSASIKNLVLSFKTVKREYVATRISRISGSDLHLQLQQGAKEVSLSFGEIIKIEVRNK